MLSPFDQIRQLVMGGEVEPAMQALAEQAVVRQSSRYRNEILLQVAKYRSLRDSHRWGTAEDRHLRQEENRVRMAILELVDLVEAQSLSRIEDGSFDVFISYRRRDGAQLARLICAELMRRNKKTFLDVENLGSGSWHDALLEAVSRSRCLALILTPGVLSHTEEQDDVLLAPLAGLPMQNGLTYSHEFFPAMVDKLISYL